MKLFQLFIQRDCAIVVISAREATAGQVAALEIRADDHMTQSFDTAEVLARIRTVLSQGQDIGALASIIVGTVVIDLEQRIVTKRGAEVHLRSKEFTLLAGLATQAGKALTHSHLLKSVWGAAHSNDLEYLRVAARGLRTNDRLILREQKLPRVEVVWPKKRRLKSQPEMMA